MGWSDPARRHGAIALATGFVLGLFLFLSPRAEARTTVGFWAGESILGADSSKPSTYWNRRDTRPYRRHLWKVLAAHRIPLYFNLRYESDFGPVPAGKPRWNDGLTIVRKANQLGVPIWGWIVIPYTDGYWAWEGAAREHLHAVKALRHWTRVEGVHLQGMVLDPEPPVDTPFDAKASILGGGVDKVFTSLLQRTIDPAGQCAAWRGYQRISHWADRNHVVLSAAPAPAALDDLDDEDLALQDASQFIVPRAHWHRLFFQVYRSAFSYYGGRKPGSGIVSSYLRSAHWHYRRVGQISLGSAGRRGYEHLGSLVRDVRVAATVGARDLPIYSLERTLRAYGGPRAINRLVWAANHPYRGKKKSAKATAVSAKAEAVRATIRRADASAAGATPGITAGLGHARPSNPWHGACPRRPHHKGGQKGGR